MGTIISEHELEHQFIEKLRGLKYEYRQDIHDRAALEQNFREKFEAFNRVKLTDGEFQRLLEEIITPDVFTAARILRQKNDFTRDDGTPLNYTLVNIRDWCKNTYEVVNQLRINTDYSHHRYDVILLINGVPVVQVELKTLGISPRRAMEQIVEYKNDPGNGYTRTLLCFIQLFIVSNRSDTWYFANNNARHFAFNADERFLPVYQFAAEDNTKVTHLDSFADTFLVKCTLGRMISRYMVLIASEQKLMVMRPYQVYAVQQILDCIHQNCGNGYIWHTTGSGKTLTSFKASTLLKDNPDIEKCVFVVDRKDLDRQTREEFNRFQEGCVEENTNTGALVRRLLSDDYADKVIVTTIQKLGLALDESSKRNKQHKKAALKAIIADYNARYGTNHNINEFDSYYQDVQQRIKSQQFPNRDLPKKGEEKIDITIVVDMLLTGFDSKYLNTLYVDKNLKHHGLIQAFSRTNRVLNASKPYGHILDFRGQQDAVDKAITLFSGIGTSDRAREIWLVDKAPVVIDRFKEAKQKLDDFMQLQGLDPKPEAVLNLRGDDARAAFINHFKEVQRLQTQLDQYTDLTAEQKQEIDQTLPKDDLRGFRGVYLETAQRLKAQRETLGFDDRLCETPDIEYACTAVDQIDFEFVLFASADIDYDYIMNLISRYSSQAAAPAQQEMTRDQLIALIRSDAKFMDELDDITAYVRSLEIGKPLTEDEVRAGYQQFKAERNAKELADAAAKHELPVEALTAFVDSILQRMIFDGEQLTDLVEPLDLGWRQRREKELALMKDLVPLLKKRAQGREISGLSAYE